MSEFLIKLCLFILGLILGILVGSFFMFRWFKKHLEKNPPITESQIKAMFKQMGRNPGEKQIKQIMASLKNKK
ncbi:MAG: YneF family protein [Vigna little leaf phytoplasma]|nr:YneF family protein [Vigna little leaf phytoplasma]MDV3198166.1 YneF family protein [Vigna little leaf phytoplasma]